MNGQHFADLLPGTAVGGFIVEALLGRGGSGVVYRARRGGESFALKLQSRMGLGGWAAREVAILMRLEHPNVVGFRHCGLHPEQRPTWFYLAMELVEGRTLHQWVREENPSARRVVALMRDLSRGLEAMHARQTLHRDIKESNIQVRESTGQAVLLDVGVGHYEGAPRLTQGILPPGTPQYRSPVAGLPAGARAAGGRPLRGLARGRPVCAGGRLLLDAHGPATLRVARHRDGNRRCHPRAPGAAPGAQRARARGVGPAVPAPAREGARGPRRRCPGPG